MYKTHEATIQTHHGIKSSLHRNIGIFPNNLVLFNTLEKIFTSLSKQHEEERENPAMTYKTCLTSTELYKINKAFLFKTHHLKQLTCLLKEVLVICDC